MSDPIVIEPGQTPDVVVPETIPDTPPAASDNTMVVDREYITSLREEAKGYRQQYEGVSKYAELFDGFDDEDRAAVEQLVALAKTGDPAARNQVAEVFGLAVPDETPNYMTPQQVQEMLDERDNARDTQSAINGVYSQAEALGFKQGTEEMVRLLWHVIQLDEPNIAAAAEQIKGEKQRYIDEYLEEKRNTANSTPRQTGSGGGSAPNTVAQPKTPAEAHAAATQRFANR